MCCIGRKGFYALVTQLSVALFHWSFYNLQMWEQKLFPNKRPVQVKPFKKWVKKNFLSKVWEFDPGHSAVVQHLAFQNKETWMRPDRSDAWNFFFDDEGSGRQARCCGQVRLQAESWGSPHCPRCKLSTRHFQILMWKVLEWEKRQHEWLVHHCCTWKHTNRLHGTGQCRN